MRGDGSRVNYSVFISNTQEGEDCRYIYSSIFFTLLILIPVSRAIILVALGG